MFKAFTISTSIITAGSLATAWWFRSESDPMIDGNGTPNRAGRPMSTKSISDFLINTKLHSDKLTLNHNTQLYLENTLVASSSTVIQFITVCFGRTYLHRLGTFQIQEDENYLNFLKAIAQQQSGKGPLITVSNHRSLLDDVIIFSGLFPFHLNIQPKYLRWTLCAQEYCFNPNNPSLLNAYISIGKVLPMWRGGGINQKLLLDFARLVAAGEWCHIFPEAGIWQLQTLGGRSNGKEHEIGKLKWGVGKLIAHSPQKVTVIPFFFLGTETIMPQDPVTKKTLTKYPIPGHQIELQFGKEISFDDLILEHETKHGKLWKYKATIEEEELAGWNSQNFHSHWDSKPSDLILYSKITRRIEQSLEQLNQIMVKT